MTRTVAALLATFFLAGLTSAEEPQKPDVIKIHLDAYRQPFDEVHFRAFLATLPRDEDYYIVEGDIALTEDEARAYLVAKSEATTRADSSAELLLNLHDGERDFYERLDQRNLTFAVDRASFPTEDAYKVVVDSILKAASDWEATCLDCRVQFTHVAAQDVSPAADQVNFIVRHRDSGGKYIARAFFPHDPPVRRVLNVDPTYFSSGFDKVGVLRHELGHVLGYRHEHIRGISGCGNENNQWVPLTPYDPHSVMHYFCGGGGSLRLELSDLDRRAHTKLYAPPAVGRLAAPATAPAGKAARALDLYRAAIAEPFDEARKRAYLGSLPRHGGYYVVEGDLRMTEDEVLSYLVARGDAPAPVERHSELLVNLHAGTRDFYRDPDQRKLTYAVDRSSFPDESQYKTVIEAMQKATQDWMDACSECKIQFVHVREQDAAPSQDKVNFTVRYQDSQGAYIAMAPFPHDPPLERYLDIDPSFFTTTFDKVGVFRHELGHILGYRHEHIRGVAGCYLEDDDWQPLTQYDPKSVMHYFCGGNGNIKLELTALDREGHHKLYGSPPTPAAGSSALVVRFEGGDVSENALRVLQILYRHDILPLNMHTVAPGESFEGIVKDHLQLPGYPKAMNVFARQLNGGRDPSELAIGEPVRYPGVQLTTYEFATKLDPEEDKMQIAQMKEKWPHLFLGSEVQPSNLVRVTLKGYELRLPVSDPAKLEKLSKQVNGLGSRNIVVYAREEPKGKSGYFGHHDTRSFSKQAIQTFWKHRQMEMEANIQGALGGYLGMTDLPDGWNRPCLFGVDCPEIVLIDTRVSPHPDLQGAVFNDSGQPLAASEPLVNGRRQKFVVANDFPESEHGTHLAGIITSQDNEFGLVGIHPGTRIYSWDWETLQSELDTLANRIGEREEEAANDGALQIYVFANSWGTSTDPQLRLTDHILSRKIVEEKVLLIAAAGQPKPASGKPPTDLSIKDGVGPMNLGDQENVLVVTACDPCEKDQPRIATWANYSTSGIVHVAAPGVDIPSTIGRGQYTTASGTSQATAFVAGVASAMACYYPRSYERARSLKTRLQVTSRPLFFGTGSAAEAAKVTAGILDQTLAMLDPTRDWIQKNGQKMNALPEQNPPFTWKESMITGTDRDGNRIPVVLSDVYRILHDPVSDKVLFYVKGKSKGGAVERIGPLKLKQSELTRPLFQPAGLGPIALSDFEDLLLSRPHRIEGEEP